MTTQRPGIQLAVETITERIIEGKPTVSIVLPTRYGKSNVIIVSIAELIARDLICCGVILSPYTDLRNQIIRPEKVAESLRLAGLDPAAFSMRTAAKFSKRLRPNEESCLSMTTQGGHYAGAIIRDWLDAERYRTGKRVALFIDECDSVTATERVNEWGYWPQQFIEAGHPVILLTATPERADDERIIGFEYAENVVREDLIRYRTKDSPKGEEYIRVERWLAAQYHIAIQADYHLEFWEAWQETPLPICKINFLPFDVTLREIGESAEQSGSMLSDLSETQVRRNLPRIVRHPAVIMACVRDVVEKIQQFKAHNFNDVGAIVFSANDQNGEGQDTDKHAKDIEREFHRQAPALRVVVVTHKMKDATDRMDAFKEGQYDVVIVKQMGAVGLDCPRIKVVADLSPIRIYRACVQRWNRGSTIYGAMRWADLIVPADCIAKHFWTKLRGPLAEGEPTEDELSTRWESLESEYDKLREEKPDSIVKIVAGTKEHDFADVDGLDARAAEKIRVRWFLATFPHMKGIISEAYIADHTREITVPCSSVGGKPRDIDSEINIAKLNLRTAVESLAGRRTQRTGLPYATVIEELWGEVKYRAGLYRYTRLEDVFDLRALSLMQSAIEALEREERASEREQA